MSLDKEFICSMFDTEDSISLVVENKIKSDYIVEDLRPVYEYITEFYRMFSKIPDVATVEKNFGTFYKKPKENTLYYIEELKNRQKFRLAKSLSEKIATLFSGETDAHHLEFVPKAVDYILQTARQVNIDLGSSSTQDIVKTTEDRKALYLHREQFGITGIPTPWEPLTNVLFGWQKKSLNVIIADTGVGKSWALTLCGIEAFKNNYRPLFFTEEMSKESLSMRIDAIMSGIPFTNIFNGTLSAKQKQDYFDYLDRLSNMDNQYIINEGAGSAGLDAVEAFTEHINPDIVLLDGAYLYAGDYDWKEISSLTKRLKAFANRINKPIVITSQKGEKNKAAYSKSFERDANNIIVMNPVQDLPMMSYYATKVRDGAPVSWVTEFDLFTMNFEVKSDIDPDEKIPDEW